MRLGKLLKVIGITGTNGKTTTSFLAEGIFKAANIACGVMGTINYRFGNRKIPAERTTPDRLTISRLLDKMLKNGIEALVMEVSSHGLDQGRVKGILFDAAIFTNLTHEHLDYHGDMDRYFASKMKLFSKLKKKGVAIFNADDRRANCIKNLLRCKKIAYGLNGPADVTAKVTKLGLDGSSFVVKLHGKDAFSVNTKLLGPHNVSNILAASALGFSQGIALDTIKEGIEGVTSIRGRLEPVGGAKGFKVFIDYAHTHNALEQVLRFLKEANEGRIITVFGCGGDRDREKRPLMGRVAEKLSDFTIITNDNPRTEDPKIIARDIESGMESQKRRRTVIFDRKKAIERALKMARASDIILIAGKGHETEQIVGKKQIASDDKKIAEEISQSL